MQLKSFTNIFQIPELRRRLLITLGILAIYRIGIAIPIPGVDVSALKMFFERQRHTIFGFLDMFSGGALARIGIFSLGVIPYINASIIMSLLQTTIPSLEKLAKEGELGHKKINEYTRYLAVLIAAIQGFGLSLAIVSMRATAERPIVYAPSFGFQMLSVITFVTGSMLAMWLGEQITEHGIGNGISLIIFAGIVDRLLPSIRNTIRLLSAEEISLLTLLLLLCIVVVTLMAVVLVETAQRRIPVQYAKRIVGHRMYGGQNTYLPLRVDQAGVIAVIFALAILSAPYTVIQFMPNSPVAQKILSFLSRGNIIYMLIYAGLIIFFCYFYTGIIMNPADLAENLKKWGGFIPGIRPGEATVKYIEWVLKRLVFAGAIFIVLIAILPDILTRLLKAPFFFGSTGLLIAVGVALDTIGQLEAHLIMRHYEGFMKKGRIKGRWFNIG